MTALFKSSLAAASAMATVLALAAPAHAAYVDPFNRVTILIDASGSYRNRQAEAVSKTAGLLKGLAEQEHKRWEKADEVIIISLDAAPEVIWRGAPAALAAVDRDEWVARFKGRSDYAACTDVAAGLNLAAKELNAGGAATNRYLFVFSDLLDERPIRGVSACAAPRATPGDDVDWEALKPLSISVFWLPVNQKMAWDAALKAHGHTTYRLHSISESAVNAIDIPKPAVHEVTETERAHSRALLAAAANKLGVGLAAVIAALVVGAGLAFVIARRRRPQGPRRATSLAAGRGVTVRGPVAPMRVPPQA